MTPKGEGSAATKTARPASSVAATTPAAAPKLKVFISYSRRDSLDFADQLAIALEAFGFEPVVDRHGIAGGEDWQKRLGALILAADTVVFVLSPESAASEICAWEVAEADRCAKRILPIVAHPLGSAPVPQRLRDLNYLFFVPEPSAPGSGFGAGLAGLIGALNTDLDWLREHTRLGELAAGWEVRGHPENRLLTGTDIDDAKAWLTRQPKTAPEPNAGLRTYIAASEENATLRASEAKRRLDEMAAAQEERGRALAEAETALKQAADAQLARARARTIIAWGSAIAAILLAGVAGFAGLQWRQALLHKEAAEVASLAADAQKQAALEEKKKAEDNLRRAEVTQSRQLIDKARQAASESDFATATLLALEALPDAKADPQTEERALHRPFVLEAFEALAANAGNLTETKVIGGVRAMSAKGDLALVWRDERFRVVDMPSGVEKAVMESASPPLYYMVFSARGNYLLNQTDGRVWDARSGALIDLPELSLPGDQRQFSPDERFLVATGAGHPPLLWSLEARTLAFELGNDKQTIADGAFSPDGGSLLTTENDNHWRIWDTASGRLVYELDGSSTGATHAYFSSSKKLVASVNEDGSAPLVVTATGVEQARLESGANDIGEFLFSPDESFVLGISYYGVSRVWDTATGRTVLTLPADGHFENAVFSPNGKMLFTMRQTAEMWNVEKGLKTFGIQGPGAITKAVFSDDGGFVAGLANSGAEVWSLGLAERVVRATDEYVISQAAFSADGRSLVTFAFDDTARFWNLQPPEAPQSDQSSRSPQSLVDRAKSLLPRCLTIAQRKELLLRPAPPLWCLKLGKYPYDDMAWRGWPDVSSDETLAKAYTDFADAALKKAGDYDMALDAADLSVRFGGAQPLYHINRAHALMYLARTDEARAEYLAFRGKTVEDQGPFEDVVLTDFKDLEHNGQPHMQLMDEIEILFKAPSLAAPAACEDLPLSSGGSVAKKC